MAWIPWPEVVLIKSWLDKNTDVHKPDFGRRGWTASNARDKERIAEKACRRKACRRRACSRKACGRMACGRRACRRRAWPQGVSPQGVAATVRGNVIAAAVCPCKMATTGAVRGVDLAAAPQRRVAAERR